MKKSFVVLALSSFILLASCNKQPDVVNKYTIKFVNDDGTTLQTSEVEEGMYPVYEGDTPSKSAPSEHEYVYIGWDKPIEKATEDTIYKASYDYVFLFGTYPQTLVTDLDLIKELKKETPIGEYDYITYNNKEYFKCPSEQSYLSDDGTRVEKNDTTYEYYEVKAIQWKILGDESDKFYTTYKLLDTCDFNEEFETASKPYPNDYFESEMREYLDSENRDDTPINKGFKWRAFRNISSLLDKIDKPEIDNSTTSTGDKENIYACDNISEGKDQVFALSRQELHNSQHGFNEKDSIDPKRVAKSTDYARARNATLFTDNSSTYWTRSPSASDFTTPKYNVYNVLCDGAIAFNATDFEGRCIRPAIILNVNSF